MKTAVQQTSIESYRDVKRYEGKQADKVFEAIRALGRCSDNMIADYIKTKHGINLPSGRVSARRNSLGDKVVLVSQQPCKITGVNANHYSVNPFPELFSPDKKSNAEKIKAIAEIIKGDDSELAARIRRAIGG